MYSFTICASELDNGLKFVSSSFDLDNTDIPPRKGAPELGQHTEEVLMEILGYSWDDVIALKDKKVIYKAKTTAFYFIP